MAWDLPTINNNEGDVDHFLTDEDYESMVVEYFSAMKEWDRPSIDETVEDEMRPIKMEESDERSFGSMSTEDLNSNEFF